MKGVDARAIQDLLATGRAGSEDHGLSHRLADCREEDHFTDSH